MCDGGVCAGDSGYMYGLMVYLLNTRLWTDIEEMEDALDVCPDVDLLAAFEIRWSGDGGGEVSVLVLDDMRCEVIRLYFVKVGLARGDKLSLRLELRFGERAGMEKLMKVSAGFMVCFSVVDVVVVGEGGGYKPRHCLSSRITRAYSSPSSVRRN